MRAGSRSYSQRRTSSRSSSSQPKAVSGSGAQAVLHRQRGQGPRDLPGAGLGVCRRQSPGQGHRLVEPPGKAGAGQHGQHVPAARRKAHGGDVAGVPAKGGDVVPHPVKGFGRVQQGVVAGAVGAVLEGGQTVEAQQTQPVSHRHKDAAGPGGQLGAGHLPGGAGAVAAAVEIHHHRQLRGPVGGVDVQPEAVLGPHRHPVAGLQGQGSGGGAVQRPGPGRGVLGRLPPQQPDGRGGIGHSIPDKGPVGGLPALHLAPAGGAEGPPEGLRAGGGLGRELRRGPQAGRGEGARLQKAAPGKCIVHGTGSFLSDKLHIVYRVWARTQVRFGAKGADRKNVSTNPVPDACFLCAFLLYYPRYRGAALGVCPQWEDRFPPPRHGRIHGKR